MSNSERRARVAFDSLSKVIPNMYHLGWSSASAHARCKENGYRWLFHAFHLTNEYGGEVFRYSKVIEDIHCMSFKRMIPPHGATFTPIRASEFVIRPVRTPIARSARTVAYIKSICHICGQREGRTGVERVVK